MNKPLLILLSLPLFTLGCQSEHEVNKISSPSMKDMSLDQTVSLKKDNLSQPFTGKVVYLQFEGGFWGVITDTNKKLDGNVPKGLRVEGLRVKGTYQVKKDVASFHMWGEMVNFTELEKE